ncbi:putative selenium-dependent hydroxylase accessory protein YqeC [uncultured Roseburia sp.]|uniref:Selenium cofactor biosynthesis protein YqeC n=1 Tax=Brotonthovivens ammoniilytica TaxID=2981725 RepID=A0ABT2TH45_9FIRM|nr:selenium cofactor biosynthesis protein YqeC [Brotonthovivens ammoniilytica]MCU6761512.1 selenium cofactor biosynthesis protein YqeC [Brotonthovivens ammoniilytica]SCI30597.1 putative selenium-dependent hydroxylase accessory protein YqeC [uncultured Roseburia sp.]
MESKNIIAFAGAGGKTSTIYACAEKYLQKQKKVLIMTTTKMGTPRQKELFTASADETAVKDVLNRYGICVTGRLVQPEKISAWPDAVMRRLARLADVVLIEADGAKMKSLKVPADYEPVIPDWCGSLVVLLGLSKMGLLCGDEVHRYQLMFSQEEQITPETYERIFLEGYGPKICQAQDLAAWRRRCCFVLNQADCKEQAEIGEHIFMKMKKKADFPFSYCVISLHKKIFWKADYEYEL